MFERFHRKSASATAAALLAALGVGGVALAQGGQSPNHAKEVPGQESTAPENSAADPDNIQQGDQTARGAANTPQSAKDQADGGTENEPGSEVPNDDGPGGHADEPGNPNADNQQQGVH